MAVAKNNITGDSIQTKVGGKAYSDGMDRIFGEKKKKDDSEYWAKLEAETQARIAQSESSKLVESQTDCH